MTVPNTENQPEGVNDQQSYEDQAVNDQQAYQPEQENNGHPAWQPILDQVPEELHGLIKPELEKWDRGVQERFQNLHSEFEPWKQFEQQGLNPDQVGQALQFLHMFDSDPEGVIRQAIEHYGLDLGQGDSDPDDNEYDDEEDEDLDDDERRYNQLERRQAQMEEQFNARQQADLDADADAALEEYLDDLADEYGEYDENYVLYLLSQGVPGPQAVQQWWDNYGQYLPNDEEYDQQNPDGQGGNGQNPNQYQGQGNQPNNGAPIVGGAGGTTGSGMADTSIKPGQLTPRQTEDLVTQILERAQSG